MKHLNIPLEDDVYDQLQDVKGDRTWQEALKDEFGIHD